MCLLQNISTGANHLLHRTPVAMTSSCELAVVKSRDNSEAPCGLALVKSRDNRNAS